MECLLNVINVENVSPSELYLYTVVDKFLSSHIREFFFFTKMGRIAFYILEPVLL